MPEDTTVESTGTAEPAPVAEASVEIPSDSGPQTVEERNAAFVAMVNGERQTEAPKVETPEKPAAKEDASPKGDTEAEGTPDTVSDEDEEDDDDLTILDEAEVDKKFSNAPKGLRKYAAAVGKKFAPYVEAINELGGIEAIKRLDKIQTLTMAAPTRPDDPAVVEYLDHIRKTNPQFATQLNTNVFYGALDEDPGLLDSVIKSELGPNWTREKLAEIAQLVEDGEIDLEVIRASANDRLDPAERTRREAEAAAQKKKDDARDAEIAELRKGQEAEKRRQIEEGTKADIQSLTKSFADAREPVLRKFGLLPLEGDPEELRLDKEYMAKKIITLVSYELGQNPVMLTINRKIESQEKGDDYDWAVLKAADMVKSKTREIAMRESKYFSAYLKSYNQPAAANTKDRRPEPLVDSALAAPKTPTPTDEAQQDNLSYEERQLRRKEGFQRMIETGQKVAGR